MNGVGDVEPGRIEFRREHQMSGRARGQRSQGLKRSAL